MNRVTVDDNAFDDFLTKKSRLKFAEKRVAKGKKPFLGIGSKQLKLKNQDLEDMPVEETLEVPAVGGDYPDIELNVGTPNTGGLPPVQEAGFFAKNKKALMIGGAVVLLRGVFFILKKRGIIGG